MLSKILLFLFNLKNVFSNIKRYFKLVFDKDTSLVQVVRYSFLFSLLGFMVFNSLFYISTYLIANDLLEFHLMGRNSFTLNEDVLKHTASNITNFALNWKYILNNLLVYNVLFFITLIIIQIATFSFFNNVSINKLRKRAFFKDYFLVTILSVLFLIFANEFILHFQIITNENLINVLLYYTVFTVTVLFKLLIGIVVVTILSWKLLLKVYPNFNSDKLSNPDKNNLLTNTKDAYFLLILVILLILFDLPNYLGVENYTQKGGFILFLILVFVIKYYNRIKNYTKLFVFLSTKTTRELQYKLLDQNNKPKYAIELKKYNNKAVLLIVMILLITTLFVNYKLVFFIIVITLLIWLGLVALIFIFTIEKIPSRKHLINTVNYVIFLPFLLFFLISVFPKKLTYTNPNYSMSVIDSLGNITYHKMITDSTGRSNPLSVPIPNDLLHKDLAKSITIVEDAPFFNQNDLIPSLQGLKNNFHGLSLRTFTPKNGGGSNINMQVVKNLSAIRNKDISRKVVEQLSSVMLSSQKTPDEILNIYINNVSFFGQNNRQGFASVLDAIYEKPLKRLNMREVFLSSNMLKYDKGLYDFVKKYNPLELPSDVKNLMWQNASKNLLDHSNLLNNTVSNILENNLMPKLLNRYSTEQREEIIDSRLRFKLPDTLDIKSQNTLFFNEFMDSLPYTHVTSVTKDNQYRILKAVNKFESEFRNELNKGNKKLYFASIVVDVKSGKIIGQYSNNRMRSLLNFSPGFPIGSTIKPIVMAHYFDKNPTLDPSVFSILDGKDPNASRFFPKGHYTNQFVNLTQMLGTSSNGIANLPDLIYINKSLDDKLATIVDIPKINSENGDIDYNFKYVLGNQRTMTLLQLAQVYQALFNNGKYVELTPYISVYNPYTFENKVVTQKEVQLFSSRSANAVKNAMKGAFQQNFGIMKGTLTNLNPKLDRHLGVSFYGKTGTTEKIDSYFDSKLEREMPTRPFNMFGYTILSDGDLLIVSLATYGELEGAQTRFGVDHHVPTASGAGSAGVLAAYIYNELKN